jgi:hypothetical protein
VLGGADLGLDDLDGQVFLLATDEAGNATPAARGTLVGSMPSTLAATLARIKRMR